MTGMNDESPKKAVKWRKGNHKLNGEKVDNGDPTNLIPTITNVERVTDSPKSQKPLGKKTQT